jgi:hypothetical protein
MLLQMLYSVKISQEIKEDYALSGGEYDKEKYPESNAKFGVMIGSIEGIAVFGEKSTATVLFGM